MFQWARKISLVLEISISGSRNEVKRHEEKQIIKQRSEKI